MQRPGRVDHGLHALDILLGTQVDLIPEVAPGTRCAHARGDEPSVSGRRLLAVVGECAQQPVGFEKRRSHFFPCGRAITAPRPFLGPGYQAGANRVVLAEGRDSPSSQQRLCVMGRYGWDYASHPQRLSVPLIRREGAYPKGALALPKSCRLVVISRVI